MKCLFYFCITLFFLEFCDKFFFFFEDNTYPHSNPFNLDLFILNGNLNFLSTMLFVKREKSFDHKDSWKGGDKEGNDDAKLTLHVVKK